MAELTDNDRNALLMMARCTIEAKLKDGDTLEPTETISPALKEKRGCFVTLQKRGKLRGCIGTIEPQKSLWQAVAENAINAALGDPRFPPVTEDEMGDIDIEISVLTPPRLLDHTGPDDLMEKLKPGVHGVILSRGWQRSTFLPQVWQQLPNKENFLGNLCMKAGMDRHCWKDAKTEIQIYEAEHFAEEK